jgi:hypothetical protein
MLRNETLEEVMGIRQFEQDEQKFYGHPLQMKSYTVFVGPLFGFQKKIVRLEELFNVWTQRGQKKKHERRDGMDISILHWLAGPHGNKTGGANMIV